MRELEIPEGGGGGGRVKGLGNSREEGCQGLMPGKLLFQKVNFDVVTTLQNLVTF